jgi:hypothetical protein
MKIEQKKERGKDSLLSFNRMRKKGLMAVWLSLRSQREESPESRARRIFADSQSSWLRIVQFGARVSTWCASGILLV